MRSRKDYQGLYIWRIRLHGVEGIFGSFMDSFFSLAYICKYSSSGVPIIFKISISCSNALSPGKIGYFVNSSMRMQPADQTSISVRYEELSKSNYGAQ